MRQSPLLTGLAGLVVLMELHWFFPICDLKMTRDIHRAEQPALIKHLASGIRQGRTAKIRATCGLTKPATALCCSMNLVIGVVMTPTFKLIRYSLGQRVAEQWSQQQVVAALIGVAAMRKVA
eukprot:gnl/TRDRNA2_/TRDRNA2_4398_c0_seq1.p3 gnl/TRDRNA2_/TRDRNA2_4398_c0~~gnl/TRDRNA2_/TRDRNA2_4398_c0_seq1.p3  ORF type:complete len:122 (+),score=14.08 gnl/TRDRNA2_/TRDRNA2_4398_c0_seq1:89-454(+)